LVKPAIVWRNQKSIVQRRLWSEARRDENSSLYIVVRSRGLDSEWEGLPNLEVIEGGARRAHQEEDRNEQSSA
jgi:hypothetical protein